MDTNKLYRSNRWLSGLYVNRGIIGAFLGIFLGSVFDYLIFLNSINYERSIATAFGVFFITMIVITFVITTYLDHNVIQAINFGYPIVLIKIDKNNQVIAYSDNCIWGKISHGNIKYVELTKLHSEYFEDKYTLIVNYPSQRAIKALFRFRYKIPREGNAHIGSYNPQELVEKVGEYVRIKDYIRDRIIEEVFTKQRYNSVTQYDPKTMPMEEIRAGIAATYNSKNISSPLSNIEEVEVRLVSITA